MSANFVERLSEWAVGYQIDWGATGTRAQLAAALIALEVARRISSSELAAQRRVAADQRAEFAGLVLGVCDVAANFIYEVSGQLGRKDDVDSMLLGTAPEPSAASIML